VELSDEALLAGLAAGDADAAAAFVRRFQRRVYGLALTILREPGAAEDAAQEAFVRAWRHAETYDPRRGRVLHWLLGIARNVAIDAVRLNRAEPLDPDVLAAAVLAKGDSDPGDAPRFADRQHLREAMRALPQDQRRALFLSAYLGRTANEIGVLEDIPLGTAKTRIRSAMIRLRAELGVADER
jgi:RNA polymerase sigma-70 factor (ECF subfamily)